MSGFSSRNIRVLKQKEMPKMGEIQIEIKSNPPSEKWHKSSGEVKGPIGVSDLFFSESSLPNFYENVSEINNEFNLQQDLSSWYKEFSPGRRCCDKLLQILKSNGLEVPSCTNTLIGKSEAVILRTVSPGKYLHMGIRPYLDYIKEEIKDIEIIYMDVGIDGLPLFKSSRQSLWPILGHFTNVPDAEVFLIGSYSGVQKPRNIEQYLHDFALEISDINSNGYAHNSKIIKLKIRTFICDAPARSFLCDVVGHNAFNGCTKCTQMGIRIENVTTYSNRAGTPRTDADFASRRYSSHHKEYSRNTPLPLEDLGIGMVSQFLVEPMHLLDLGACKKILHCLIKGETLKMRLTSHDIQVISNKLNNLRQFTPCEFIRKPRGLEELPRWKATELRQFILYTSVVVLKDHLTEDYYYHLLLFHCAYRLLLSKNFLDNIDVAENMLQDFVQHFSILYPVSKLTYNIHNILHIAQCVREIGPIQGFSAYKFENFLQVMKRKVKSPSNILQQLHRQFSQYNIKGIRPTGTKKNRKGIITSYTTGEFTLSAKNPDNSCLLSPAIPFFIRGFKEKDTKVYIVGSRFYNTSNFFEAPLKSGSDLGILVASQIFLKKTRYFQLRKFYLSISVYLINRVIF